MSPISHVVCALGGRGAWCTVRVEYRFAVVH